MFSIYIAKDCLFLCLDLHSNKGDASFKGENLILGEVKTPYSFLVTKRCIEMYANMWC